MLPLALLLITSAQAHEDPSEIRYVQNQAAYDEPFQRELAQLTAWRFFAQRHPSWHVLFNEGNRKPHRAYGNAIPVGAGDLVAKSWQFIANELEGFQVPAADLVLLNTRQSAKYQYVDFIQTYQGLEIINSRLNLKFTKQGEVVLFGLDVFNDIQLDITPSISEQQALLLAQADLHHVNGTQLLSPLKVLAVPVYRGYRYHLVREVEVTGTDEEGVEARWEVLVDAQTGTLLSRQNKVVRISPPESGGNLRLQGTIYPKHPYATDSIVQLPHLQFSVGGQTYFTDSLGVYDQGISGLPLNGTFPLQGRWSRIVHGNTGMNTPTFSLSVDSLLDSILYDGRGTSPAINSIRHLSAYYHTTLVHDYMKSLMPNFTALDIALTTRVDRTDGSCNAFFNGNSINFYVTAGGCNALSMAADVVYHEYGHAITNYFYGSFGLNFQNGAMGEGYSDIYAITLTGDPVLGIGFSSTNQNMSIRRYDINPKIFPQNLVGQVHADGEIICGAWYQTGQNIGSDRTMMEILAESMYALAMAPNGQEGILYTDILIDALQADDNDGNLSNGTPHFNEIVNGFGFHGIRLLANVSFNFTPFLDQPENSPIPASVQLNVAPPFDAFINGVMLIYRLNNAPASSSDTVRLTSQGGNTYTGTIPAQPKGTIVYYYAALIDNAGGIGGVQPAYADVASNPGLPYNMLIGFTEYDNNTFEAAADDSLFELSWPTDNATSGFWEIGVPIPSFADPGNPASIVQPGSNATPGGTRAAFTQNAPTVNSPIGTADVDGGRATLVSPTYDLSLYSDPVMTYMRWFTNDMGNNPNQDFWEVYVNNGNAQWRLVERTNRSDRSWRRNAIRISNLVAPTATVRFRFIAQDPNPGSIVEAAIDDIRFYDQSPATSVRQLEQQLDLLVYPNPTSGELFIRLNAEQAETAQLQLRNTLGQLVHSSSHSLQQGEQQFSIQLGGLTSGVYFLQLQSGDAFALRRVVVE